MQTVARTENQAEISIGRGKQARRAYGFDEVSLVPGSLTLDFELCDVSVTLGSHHLAIPLMASAMDGVVDVGVVGRLGKLGGLAVLNLQGVQTRYENPAEALEQIAGCDKHEFVGLMQKLYSVPVKEELIAKRVKEMKALGVVTAASVTPNMAEKYGRIAVDAGLDIIVVQSTVTGIEHRTAAGNAQLDLKSFVEKIGVPVIVGNCVTYDSAYRLMETGVAGILVGVGPGAACTSRSVLGVGVPMATSIADCAAAREDYQARSGRYVLCIADGGMAVGGDICKAIACGADAVMIGSPFARATDAPGRGYHWGMATPSPVLPRGTRIRVGSTVSLEQIVNGPAQVDDGTQNLIGALKTSMATLGAATIKEMQDVEVVIAPSILSEGKVYQHAQELGMGRK
ncbi:MAG: GuaB3 family IMP dehydrogenase-related protein [Candidatus Obscuribacterales bacterium]|nr:GuaB3 family IMP dehydrogenase-related protein [Candidatus Obscuribacterales bacterium]